MPLCSRSVVFCLAALLLTAVQGLAGNPIDSTQKVVVRSITLKGNYRTRDRIIRREMAIHVGDSIRLRDVPDRVAWDQRNINNTTLFITVDTQTRITPSDDSTQLATLDLTILMKERWYIIAYPIVELADRNFNEWYYDRNHDFSRLVYGGRLSYRNITGNNDRLQLAAAGGFLQRYTVSYSIPYIDKAQKIGLRVDLGYQTNKEIPYRSQFDKWVYARSDEQLRDRAFAGFTLTNRQGLYHYHTLDLRYNRLNIADTVAQLNPDYFLDGRTRLQYSQLTYTYRYDRRDNVVYPLRGTLFSAGASLTGLLPSDNYHFLDLATSITRYWPLGGKFFAAGNLRLRGTWPDRQPYYLLHGLGNSVDIVRGYELNVIDGQRTAVWRNSLRYQLLNTRYQLNWLHVRQFNTVPVAVYLTGFADAGYVRSTVAEEYQSLLANKPLFGTGLSLDIVSFYNLVLRFSGTINAQGVRGFFFNLAQEL